MADYRELCERLRGRCTDDGLGDPMNNVINPDGDEAASAIESLLSEIERKDEAIVALANGADKCGEAPHFIVQPFLAIHKKHGETITQSRAALSSKVGGE